jgi:hypothetical protein
MVLSDDEEPLARRAVVSTGKVVEPVISRVETVDNRKVHRASGLYDAPAHAAKVVIGRLVVKLWDLWNAGPNSGSGRIHPCDAPVRARSPAKLTAFSSFKLYQLRHQFSLLGARFLRPRRWRHMLEKFEPWIVVLAIND